MSAKSLKFLEIAARQSATRGTARFDVHVIYEKKVDVAAECERLKKELEKSRKKRPTINGSWATSSF